MPDRMLLFLMEIGATAATLTLLLFSTLAFNLQIGLQKKLDFGDPPKLAGDKAPDVKRPGGS
jgi:hypothetical protein